MTPSVQALDAKAKQAWVRLAARTLAANARLTPSRVNAELEAAAKSEPQSAAAPAYFLWIADNLAREGRYTEAVHAYDAAVTNAESARRLLADVDPICCALLHKAQTATLKQDAGAAINAYKDLARASSTGSPFFQAGLAAETLGDDDQAADLYLSAVTEAASFRTDRASELARRALLRLQDERATYFNSAFHLADALATAFEERNIGQLDLFLSRTHFTIGPVGGHTQFEEVDLREQLFSDLLDSDVRVQRKLVGSGGKLYQRTIGWKGSLFRGDIICVLTSTPKGWQWVGVAVADPHDRWLQHWQPSTRRLSRQHRLLPFSLFAPWPAGRSFRAGGLTEYSAQQAAVVAAGIFGPALALGFSMNPCGFGPNGFYYNQGSTHSDEDAFAIDFMRYQPNVPYDNESGGTPVLAAHDGIVASVSAGTPSGDSSASNTVEIVQADPDDPTDTNRYRSRYLHLAGPFMVPVSAMMPLIAGQRIGLMDDTGNSFLFFDHLHFSFHDRDLPHPNVPYGESVRPSPLSGITLGDGDSATCVESNNVERFADLNFRPTVVTFSSVPVGESRVQTLTAINTSGAEVELSFPASPPGSPIEWDAFDDSIPNGEERAFQVTFRPVSSAIAQATLTATSTAPGSPHSIGLLGKGVGGFPPDEEEEEEPVPPAELELTPEILNFGSVVVGNVRTLTMTMHNTTNSEIEVTIKAPASSSVFQWKAFTAVLAKGEKKNRQVTFQPTSTAISQGTLKVVNTGPGSPHSIDLLGKGAGGFPVP